jgi:hypothetical protein
LSDFSTHGFEKLGFIGIVKMVLARPFRMVYGLIWAYLASVHDLLKRAGGKRRQELRSLAKAHDQEFTEFALHVPYTIDSLRKIASLRKRPVEYSLLRTINTFYFDRFVAVAAALGLGAFFALFPLELGIPARLIGLASTAIGFVGYMALSIHLRRQDVDGDLAKAAEKLADHSGARYVVFGHTHHPGCKRFPSRSRRNRPVHYFNTGSWVTREVARGSEGQGMTFVTITDDGAALCKWMGTSSESPIKILCQPDRPIPFEQGEQDRDSRIVKEPDEGDKTEKNVEETEDENEDEKETSRRNESRHSPAGEQID